MDAVTSANTPACPHCGSRRLPVVVQDNRGEQLLCPECEYPISIWRRNG